MVTVCDGKIKALARAASCLADDHGDPLSGGMTGGEGKGEEESDGEGEKFQFFHRGSLLIFLMDILIDCILQKKFRETGTFFF
jgi:hypothetical protein